MKKIITLTLIAGAVVFSAFTLATLWKADEKASTVNWSLPNGNKAGTFSGLTSSINFDKDKLADSKITASIDVKTLKAGNEKLEAHLLTADFFDAEKFPKITFTSTQITAKDAGFIAKGTLNMKDSTKVIELPFTFTEKDKTNAVFSGTMTIDSNDYGVTKKKAEGEAKPNTVVITLNVPVTK